MYIQIPSYDKSKSFDATTLIVFPYVGVLVGLFVTGWLVGLPHQNRYLWSQIHAIINYTSHGNLKRPVWFFCCLFSLFDYLSVCLFVCVCLFVLSSPKTLDHGS